MVTFNELRISDKKDCLIIDVEVEKVDVFENMYIDSIYLEYYKNVNPASGMPGEKAVLVWENTSRNKINTKAVRLNYSINAKPGDSQTLGVSTFNNGLFYVIVNVGGDPSGQVGYMACGTDIPKRIGAVLDWEAFYNRGMQYVNSLFNGCDPCPDLTGFEHFAVLWNALKMALSTCDWNLVSNLWDKFLLAPSNPFTASSGTRTPGGCGCR